MLRFGQTIAHKCYRKILAEHNEDNKANEAEEDNFDDLDPSKRDPRFLNWKEDEARAEEHLFPHQHDSRSRTRPKHTDIHLSKKSEAGSRYRNGTAVRCRPRVTDERRRTKKAMSLRTSTSENERS